MSDQLPADPAQVQARIGRHIPAEGEALCPACQEHWPCQGYLEAIAERDMLTEWSPARVEQDVLPPWGPLPPLAGQG